MGTKLVRELVAEAADYLNDETNEMWSTDVLLRWLNYAERLVCTVKNDAYIKVKDRVLSSGLLQSMADDAISVGTLVMNMGTDGATAGRAITEKHLHVMNLNPSWTMEDAAEEVLYFIRIPGDDTHFYVSPPVTEATTVYVREVYPAYPPELTVSDWDAGTETINVPDRYIDTLLDLILFRACDSLKVASGGASPIMAQKSVAALNRAVLALTGTPGSDE